MYVKFYYIESENITNCFFKISFIKKSLNFIFFSE